MEPAELIPIPVVLHGLVQPVIGTEYVHVYMFTLEGLSWLAALN